MSRLKKAKIIPSLPENIQAFINSITKNIEFLIELDPQGSPENFAQTCRNEIKHLMTPDTPDLYYAKNYPDLYQTYTQELLNKFPQLAANHYDTPAGRELVLKWLCTNPYYVTTKIEKLLSQTNPN